MAKVSEVLEKLDSLLKRSRAFHLHLEACEQCQHSVFLFCEAGKKLFDEMDARALPGPLSHLEDGSFSDERTAELLRQREGMQTLTEITDELLGKYRP